MLAAHPAKWPSNKSGTVNVIAHHVCLVTKTRCERRHRPVKIKFAGALHVRHAVLFRQSERVFGCNPQRQLNIIDRELCEAVLVRTLNGAGRERQFAVLVCEVLANRDAIDDDSHRRLAGSELSAMD